MVGLGMNYPLRIAWTKPNGHRGTLRSTDGTTQDGYSREKTWSAAWSSFATRQRPPSFRQYDQWSHSKAWLGSAATPTILSPLGTNGFPPHSQQPTSIYETHLTPENNHTPINWISLLKISLTAKKNGVHNSKGFNDSAPIPSSTRIS